MTAKRFTQKDEDDWEILDRGKHFAYAHSGYQAKKIIDELNELVDTNRELYKENKQLKSNYKQLHEKHQYNNEFIADVMVDCERLEKENEQLKQRNNRLEEKIQRERTSFTKTRERWSKEAETKIKELLEENEQLKQELKTKCIVNKQYEENQRLIKMLDNVANYMQKQYKDMSIDDFVEWWNKMETEGLEND